MSLRARIKRRIYEGTTRVVDGVIFWGCTKIVYVVEESHTSCQLYGSEKKRGVCVIQEKLQSRARLHRSKDSDSTNLYEEQKKKRKLMWYDLEYGNSWFINRENHDAYYTFR